MAVSSGNIIYGADYNAVQVKVVQILGSGSPYGPGTANPNYGYNQTVTSSLVAASAVITASQWQLLANDVNKIALHQTNANFAGYSTSYETSGKTITAADLNTLDNNMNTYITNRLTANGLQLQSATTPYWRSTNWGGAVAPAAISQTGTFNLGSADAAQYFFNQGGLIVFQGTYRGTPVTSQDTAWRTESTAFTYTINITTYALLTGTATTVYTGTGGTPYGANALTLQLSASAGVITYTLTYNDAHVASGAGPDTVTGSATVGVGFNITPYTSFNAVVGTAPTIGVNAGSTFV